MPKGKLYVAYLNAHPNARKKKFEVIQVPEDTTAADMSDIARSECITPGKLFFVRAYDEKQARKNAFERYHDIHGHSLGLSG